MEVPATTAGRIRDVKVRVGDKVSQGDVLAIVEGAGARRPAARAAGRAGTGAAAAPAPARRRAAAPPAVAATANGTRRRQRRRRPREPGDPPLRARTRRHARRRCAAAAPTAASRAKTSRRFVKHTLADGTGARRERQRRHRPAVAAVAEGRLREVRSGRTRPVDPHPEALGAEPRAQLGA